MKNSAVRFAIIGLDHWYSAIPLAEAIVADPGAELAAVIDRDVHRARAVAKQVGCDRYGSDFGSVIADPTIDVVASFVSVDRNPDVCVAAARAGKHIISVKPLALNLAEADRIVDAVQSAGVIFMPGESRSRASEQNQLIFSTVRGGDIGEIVHASFSLSGLLPQQWPGVDGPGWWGDPARTVGGGWIDHAIYQIDRIRWLLDDEPAEILGRVANLKYPDLRVEDYGHALLRFSRGVTVSIEDTWAAPAEGWRISTSIVGTEGSLHIDTSTGEFAVLSQRNGERRWRRSAAPSDFSEGVGPMLEAIAGNGAQLSSVLDARANLKTCLAFYESARSGRAVSIVGSTGTSWGVTEQSLG